MYFHIENAIFVINSRCLLMQNLKNHNKQKKEHCYVIDKVLNN